MPPEEPLSHLTDTEACTLLKAFLNKMGARNRALSEERETWREERTAMEEEIAALKETIAYLNEVTPEKRRTPKFIEEEEEEEQEEEEYSEEGLCDACCGLYTEETCQRCKQLVCSECQCRCRTDIFYDHNRLGYVACPNTLQTNQNHVAMSPDGKLILICDPTCSKMCLYKTIPEKPRVEKVGEFNSLSALCVASPKPNTFVKLVQPPSGVQITQLATYDFSDSTTEPNVSVATVKEGVRTMHVHPYDDPPVYSMAALGDYVYLAWYKLFVFEMRCDRKKNLVEIMQFDEEALGIEAPYSSLSIANGRLYALISEYEELFVYDLKDPSCPVLLHEVSGVSGSAVTVCGRMAYCVTHRQVMSLLLAEDEARGVKREDGMDIDKLLLSSLWYSSVDKFLISPEKIGYLVYRNKYNTLGIECIRGKYSS
eukprot:TRINITY_DN4422_c1_g1_i1.p1 TRINITY_DN4422_c1_g1~~TRINITY_DN4422_c1_g1_i1.p1  ORF type:complete len:434 (+),score=83.58 TRINITY_DN4422_c1_g1_i1:24-1304(+)